MLKRLSCIDETKQLSTIKDNTQSDHLYIVFYMVPKELYGGLRFLRFFNEFIAMRRIFHGGVFEIHGRGYHISTDPIAFLDITVDG